MEKESIDDTLSLITHDDLQKAIQIIRKSSYTSLFAVSNNLLITQEFQHNMSRIKKRVDICLLQGETIFKAHLADSSLAQSSSPIPERREYESDNQDFEGE